MKIDRVLTELVIFAKERGGDDESQIAPVIRAAERHLYRLKWMRAHRERVQRKPFCERCEGPSSSGILCWACLNVAPPAIRHAFRDARGLEGVRDAAAKMRTWIKTSSGKPRRRVA